jgi:spore germination protein GerM
MSEERELLKQVVENFAYVQDMHLIVAIQKLLNQPEQVQEPLGTQVSFKDSSGKLITVDISFVRELVERDSEVFLKVLGTERIIKTEAGGYDE